MISVIIPVYNVEKYLNECLNSVCSQTFENLEIILVDDGSTDDSSKICDEWSAKDSRVRVIHQLNAGLSEARNSGLKYCKGDYILYIDSDDSIEEDLVESLMNLIEKHNVDIAMCTHRLKVNGIVEKRPFNSKIITGTVNELLKFIFENGLWHAWGKLIKRELALEAKFIPRLIYEDYENNPRLLLNAKRIAISMDGRYIYSVRGDSIMEQRKKSTDVDFAKITDELLKLYEESNYSSDNKNFVCSFLFKQLVYNYHITISWNINKTNEFILYSRHLLRKEKSKWLKCSLISWKRKIAYLMIGYLPFLYDNIYRITHKARLNLDSQSEL